MPDHLQQANTGWWNGGTGTAVGTVFGNFWNEVTGTTANNTFNAEEAEKARLFNSAEAQKQRDFEMMMSNSAYQRAAADMKAAGINPASLGGNGAGSAASTPQGSAANGGAATAAPGRSSVVGAILEGIGMALKMKMFRSTLGLDKEALNLKKFQANTDQALKAAKKANLDASTALKQNTIDKNAGRARAAQIRAEALRKEAARLRREHEERYG